MKEREGKWHMLLVPMHHVGNFTVLSYLILTTTMQHRLTITEATVQMNKCKAVVLIYTAYDRSHIELWLSILTVI